MIEINVNFESILSISVGWGIVLWLAFRQVKKAIKKGIWEVIKKRL